MQSGNVNDKSKDFAVRIVNLYKHLVKTKREFVLSKQILRSGTSIGANISEANCSISSKEFRAKMYISFKEANETIYWLELLYKTDFLTKNEYDSIYADCLELRKMLSSITKTLSKK